VHVLTKIFVVLVSLLAVMLTPLVVVYARNEGTYRSRFLDASSQAKAANASLELAKQGFASSEQRLISEKQTLESDLSNVRKERDSKDGDLRRFETEMAAAKTAQSSMSTQLATLAASLKADSELKELLVGELRGEREKALAAERRFIEIDERLRKTENDLQTMEAARRDLQEQLKQVVDEKDRALGEVAKYIAYVGKLPETRRASAGGVVPDRDLTAAVLNVRRSADGVLAEISAGSRDGVQEGWLMTIADGGTFIGNLRIVKVDVNRSTGVVELEDAAARGEAKPGQRVIAKAGG